MEIDTLVDGARTRRNVQCPIGSLIETGRLHIHECQAAVPNRGSGLLNVDTK